MKFITVAKDKEAMEALDYDIAQSDQIWEYIVNEEEVATLFLSGLIDEINQICNSMIDDHEAEMISDMNHLQDSLRYLSSIKASFKDQHLIGVLIDMFEKAIKSSTAVYFYF